RSKSIWRTRSALLREGCRDRQDRSAGASQRLDASCTLSTFRASPRATDRTPPLSRAAGQHGARHEACSSAVAVKKGEVSHANPSARSGLVAGVWGGTRGTEREAGRKDSE